MKAFLTLLIILMAMPLQAQDISNNQELCEQLQEAKRQMKDQNLPKISSARLKLLIHKIFPSLSYKLKDMGEFRPAVSKNMQGRNVIVAFGVPSENKALIQKYHTAQAEMKGQTRLFLSLLKQKSTQRCISRASSLGFEAKAFFKLRDEISQMTIQRNHEEYREVIKQFHKTPRRVRNRWEIKTGFHAAELKALLETNTIDHLVIVAHANDKGHLTDSYGNYLPNGFFQGISSLLKSLSFFTCYGEKVVDSFQLKGLKDGLKIFYPKSKSPYLKDVTLLPALPSFMKKISKRIKKTNGRKSKMPEECSLEILEGKLEEGEISFLLGDNYLIGHYRNGEKMNFTFDCNLLKKQSMISVRTLKLKDSFKLLEEWRLIINTPVAPYELERINHFINDGDYKGSLYTL